MDWICSTIVIGVASVLCSMGFICFLAALLPRKDINEACGVCCKCGTTEAPIDVQGKLYCIACIRKNRKSMGEYMAMPWHSGGCSK